MIFIKNIATQTADFFNPERVVQVSQNPLGVDVRGDFTARGVVKIDS
jgi:hypothetical protein